MRGAIDWSYQLLDEEEQRLFAYLSVFASGCTLDAAEAVGADGQLDVIAGIGSLVEKSLLRREGDDEPRFLMAEPVREYATERFAKDEHANVVRRRHADYYSSLAAQGSTELSGPRHLEWSQRLAEEHDNLRAVLDWYRTRGEEEGLKLAVSLTRFWELRGHLVEGRRWLEVFLAGTQSIPLQAAALCAIGTLARTQGDYDSSVRSLETALKLVREHGDERAIASVLHTFGRVVWGNPERALALLQESRATVRATGDKRLLARALINEGLQLSWSGLSARAKVLAEESLALYQELGDDQGAAVALLILSGAAHWEGDYDGARGLSDESEALLRRVGLGVDFLEATQLMALQTRDQGNYRQAELVLDTALAMCDAGGYRPLRATMRRLSGLMARERGEYERATQLYEESLAEYRDLQDRENRDMAIVGLSDIARDLGDVEGVVDWCSTLLPRAKDASHTYPRGWALNNLGIVAGQQGAFERAHELFSQALAMGRNLTESYRAEVLSAVGWVLLQEAQYRRALATLSESLRLSQTVGPVFLFATVLEGTASAAAGDGLLEHAAILFGAAEAMRDRIGAPIWPSRRALYDRYRAVARDGLGEERFHEGHQTGQSLSERDAIAYALRHFPAQVEPVTVAGEV